MSQVPGPGAPEAALRPVSAAMVYADFRLLIEGTNGVYRPSVVESPGGESRVPESISWAQGADRLETESDIRRAGASLFDAFIAGEVRELLRSSMALARAQGKGLRIKLLIDPPELSQAPWELLYDGQNRSYLGLSTKTPIVRHPRVPQEVERLSIKPPLRILGLVANPSDPGLPRLDVTRERKLIDTALADLQRAGLVELKWLDGGTSEELHEALLQSWHVFHFSGHGDYDAQTNEGYLLLEDPHGRAHRLAATDLGVLLRGQGDVRLAVLNSCKGAVGDTSASSNSTAGALIRAGMGGVVAMQNPISDRAALTFARVMYLAIARDLPLETAVGSARIAMKVEHPALIEWWTPVLNMRSRDGALFAVPSPPAESQLDLPGMEYLGPDVERRLERVLAQGRRRKRLFYSWMLAPIPLLGFLTFSNVSSDFVSADIEASGVTFVLSSERELFSELPRLQSFSLSGFRAVTAPGSAFPVSPGPNQDASVRADAADTASWIYLQPWTLPDSTAITWDHPHNARAGEYLVSVAPGVGRSFSVGLFGRIRMSTFGAAAEVRDYGNAAMEVITSNASLRLDMQLQRPADLKLPHLTVDSLEMVRQGFNDTGPLAESTVLGADVHVNGRDLVLDATHLAFDGLRGADMNRIRLTDRGVAFTISGMAKRISVGGKDIALPSRLQWLIREHPSYLWLYGLAYALTLVVVVVSWRTIHVPRSASK